MVGIVIVSHSQLLAESLKDLALEMGKGKAKVAVAGGVDDPDNPVGTDAMKILNAINEVYSDEGVVVFMDLGSAVMSAGMAVEFLDVEQKKHIRLCGAPLVEGVITATALAGAGAAIEEIVREARSSIAGKTEQLGETGSDDTAGADSGSGPDEDARKERFTLHNTMGLHARPAARIVQALADTNADVQIRNLSRDGDFVSARSMNSLISLNVKQNDTLEISFSGPDAQQVFETIAAMMENNFGESTLPAIKSTAKGTVKSNKFTGKDKLKGISVSPGFAVGPVFHHKISLPKVSKKPAGTPEEERTGLNEALEQAEADIEELKKQSRSKIGEEEAAIFDAQVLLLKDPELLKKAEQRIKEGMSASAAWKESLGEMIQMYEQITGDSLASTRKIDLVDVGRRVLEKLSGKTLNGIELSEPSVICTHDISPSDAASLKSDQVLAICCEAGSDVSHSAIIARSIGIPAVFNLGEAITALENGHLVAVDAEQGEVHTNPDKELISQFNARRDRWMEMKERAHAGRKKPGITADQIRVTVLANVGNAHEINQVLDMGAEGVGLFRTEFLFMEREEAPDEQEQFKAFKLAARALGRQKPLVIRTLDAGGDKPVPYLNIAKEENPFLGRRGIRYSLDEPDQFRTQLRALLRASAFGRIEIMFPMIAHEGELRQALDMLDRCRKELDDEGVSYDKKLKTGIMVEVPAAVENLGRLLPLIDFVSIGTNDLSQYIMAADRTNASVATLSTYFQPALLHVIERIIKQAGASGKEISMCGEMARDTLVTPLLLAWGLRKFSMSAAGIPEFKHVLRNIDVSGLESLPEKVNECGSAEDVRNLLQEL